MCFKKGHTAYDPPINLSFLWLTETVMFMIDKDLAAGVCFEKSCGTISLAFLVITDWPQTQREHKVKCKKLWNASLAKHTY